MAQIKYVLIFNPLIRHHLVSFSLDFAGVKASGKMGNSSRPHPKRREGFNCKEEDQIMVMVKNIKAVSFHKQ
jgi:hypothetical protein